MKHIVVLLTENNSRILKVSDPSPYLRARNCLVNPDLRKVEGVPPHFWKISAGEVVPMDYDERLARSEHIAEHGIKNNAPLDIPVEESKKIGLLTKIKQFILGR